MFSTENMKMSNIIHIKHLIFRNAYVCACMYMLVPMINERRHESEREHGGVYGKVWREKREGNDDAIILQFQK